MAELLTGLADGRRVDDRHEPGGVGHEHPIEERFVGVLQLREVDVALEVRRLPVELRERPPQLRVEIVDALGEKAKKPERLALLLAEGRRLVAARVMEQIGPARRRHPQRRISAWTCSAPWPPSLRSSRVRSPPSPASASAACSRRSSRRSSMFASPSRWSLFPTSPARSSGSFSYERASIARSCSDLAPRARSAGSSLPRIKAASTVPPARLSFICAYAWRARGRPLDS